MQPVSAWHVKHTDICLGTVTPFVEGESTPETGQWQEANLVQAPVYGLNHSVPVYPAIYLVTIPLSPEGTFEFQTSSEALRTG